MRRYGSSGHVLGRIAGFVWSLTIHCFVAQVIAVWAWRGDYSWGSNSISDLGVSHCGVVGGHDICSPLSGFFNASLFSVGAALSLGSVLVRVHLGRKRPLATAGFGCVALAGAGGMLLGLFPAGTEVLVMHHTGAVLVFVFGTAGILTLPAVLDTFPRPLRRYTLVNGIVSTAGLVLFGLYFFADTGPNVIRPCQMSSSITAHSESSSGLRTVRLRVDVPTRGDPRRLSTPPR